VKCGGVFKILLLYGYVNILRGGIYHDSNTFVYHESIPLTYGSIAHDTLQKSGIPEQFEIVEFACDVDIPHITASVISDLLGIRINVAMSRIELLTGLNRLAKQGRFSLISFTMSKKDHGYALKCIIHAACTVDRVNISGFLLGKERLRQWYLLKPGYIFDEAKHQEGVRMLCSKLYNEGYFNATVDDVLQRDTVRHAVMVNLYVHQGDRFLIRDIVVNISGVADQEYKKLYYATKSIVKDDLDNVYYDRVLLNQSAEKIRSMLVDQGYITSIIKVREQLHRDKATIDLIWDVEVSG